MKTWTVVVLAWVAAAHAQTPTPATFEAASVKPNTSVDTRIRFETPAGRLTAINTPLRFLIRQAYRVPASRVIGGPAWIDSDRFDILATASGPANSDALRMMLRTLLKDRFGLELREETREMPIYALRLARTDATLGPNLRRSATDCAGRPSSLGAGRVQCGVLVSQNAVSASLRGGGATMESFLRLLADFLDRPLIDGTGLTGTFDVELQFAIALTTAVDVGNVPPVSTALQEQLGLRLEAQRGRADVLVIDRVSPPTAD